MRIYPQSTNEFAPTADELVSCAFLKTKRKDLDYYHQCFRGTFGQPSGSVVNGGGELTLDGRRAADEAGATGFCISPKLPEMITAIVLMALTVLSN